MEEKKKSNIGLIIGIVILVILVVVMGGYITWEKVLVPKQGEKTYVCVDNKSQFITTTDKSMCKKIFRSLNVKAKTVA